MTAITSQATSCSSQADWEMQPLPLRESKSELLLVMWTKLTLRQYWDCVALRKGPPSSLSFMHPGRLKRLKLFNHHQDRILN